MEIVNEDVFHNSVEKKKKFIDLNIEALNDKMLITSVRTSSWARFNSRSLVHYSTEFEGQAPYFPPRQILQKI